MNPTAIEGHLKFVIIQWFIIVVAALLIGRGGRKIGQPLAVGEILAGLLLGPSFLGLFWPESWPELFPATTQQSLQLLGKIGILLLVFQIGMEFDYGHLRSNSKTVTAVSILGIAAPMLGGLAIGPWLHTSFAPDTPYLGFQLFVCVAVSITALPIMGRILLELGLERTSLGAISISAAAIDDVVGWILLAVCTTLATTHFAWAPFLTQVFGTVAFFLFLMKVVGPLTQSFRRRLSATAGDPLPPAFLAVLLCLFFVSCLVTNALGIFAIFGAFLFGVSLHQDRALVQAWKSRFADFVLVAFVPIFFTNTGLRTDIGSLSGSTAWLGCLAVLLVATVGKLGGCWIGARYTGQGPREAISIAALMNTRALMGLVAINVGFELGFLPKELFTMFVIMALVTTAMTGPLLAICLPQPLKDLIPRGGTTRVRTHMNEADELRRTA